MKRKLFWRGSPGNLGARPRPTVARLAAIERKRVILDQQLDQYATGQTIHAVANLRSAYIMATDLYQADEDRFSFALVRETEANILAFLAKARAREAFFFLIPLLPFNLIYWKEHASGHRTQHAGNTAKWIVIEALLILIAFWLGCLAIFWLGLCNWTFSRLNAKHPKRYIAMGRPLLRFYSSPKNSRLFLRFLWRSEYSSLLNDKTLKRVCLLMKIFMAANLVVFLLLGVFMVVALTHSH